MTEPSEVAAAKERLSAFIAWIRGGKIVNGRAIPDLYDTSERTRLEDEVIILASHEELTAKLAEAEEKLTHYAIFGDVFKERDELARQVKSAEAQRDGALLELSQVRTFWHAARGEATDLARPLSDGLTLLNKHLTGNYTDLDDALRNLLQAYITTKGNF